MSDIKKFLDLTGLTTYDGKIKQLISNETTPGKNADKALKAFLGDPTGYPDENIPLYSETVNAAADAKAAAITAQNSASNSAAAAAESAQTTANILGKSDDTSDKNTVYGVYAKVDERVNTGLGEIAGAVDDGIRTLQDKAGEISGDLDKYVIDEVKPVIDDTKILAVNAVNDAKTAGVNAVNDAETAATEAIDSYVEHTAKPAIATDLAVAKQDISKDLANAKAAIATDLENAQSAISDDLTSASETISAELTAATDAIDIAQGDAEAAIATASGNAVDAVEGAQADAKAAIATDLENAQSAISGDLASAKQEIIEATITATNTISADLTTAKQDITNATTAAVKDVNDAVAPVTAAKNDAEAAKNAAVVAKVAAEAAANTATNAVTGFRNELGDRPDTNSTVWGSIEELKSATAGGVHFIGTTGQLPWEGVQNTTIGRSIHGAGTQEYSVGDIIIVASGGNEQGFNEPTKEYILSYGNVSNPDDGSAINGYRWVELGDVSPADQKITALETNKLNKSALVSTEDTLADIESHNTHALVELTADDHAFVRLDTILDTMIVAIPTSDINALFE